MHRRKPECKTLNGVIRSGQGEVSRAQLYEKMRSLRDKKGCPGRHATMLILRIRAQFMNLLESAQTRRLGLGCHVCCNYRRQVAAHK